MNELSILYLFSSKPHEHCRRRAKRLLESEVKEDRIKQCLLGITRPSVPKELSAVAAACTVPSLSAFRHAGGNGS